MPQMMPINWILSFFMFILIFMLFNILNYYIFNFKTSYYKKNNQFNLKKNFWKL